MSLQRLGNIKKFIQESIEGNNYMIEPEESLIRTRNILVNFLKDDALSVAKSNNIEPRLMRGMISELMCEYLFKFYIEENGFNTENYISNVMLTNDETGRTTQLDSICVIDKSVFVIECKSFYGPLSINNGVIKTKTIEQEPWKQNRGHIWALEKEFGKLNYINVVYLFGMGLIREYKPTRGKDGDNQHLLVNHGGLSTINKLSKDPMYKNKAIPSQMIPRLKQLIPTIEEEYAHIENINKLREMIRS